MLAWPPALSPPQIFVKEILQKPTRYFWIGLSVPSGGQGWTWLNGSHLDPSR